MQLSIHKRYLRTNTQNTIVVYSTQYESYIRQRYSNLEIYLLPLTDTVQLPVNGPCKSRYLAKNVICTTVLSFNIQLYHCIPLFPRLYLYNTYLPNTDYTDYTDNKVVLSSEKITLTLSVQRPHLLTYSYDIVLLYSIGCIYIIPSCRTLITLITLIIESFFIIWTDNVNAICTTTISSDIQLWCCIAVFPRLYPPNTYLPNTDYTD